MEIVYIEPFHIEPLYTYIGRVSILYLTISNFPLKRATFSAVPPSLTIIAQ